MNTTYDYKVLQAGTLISAEQLNQLSAEGWRLITIVPVGILFYFYFERQVT